MTENRPQIFGNGQHNDTNGISLGGAAITGIRARCLTFSQSADFRALADESRKRSNYCNLLILFNFPQS
ncbi:MAG: hypothetical protein WCF30_10555 [Terracidiphilus sp.]